MQLELGSTLIYPSGDPTKPDQRIDLVEMHKLEARQQEIAFVNKVTAPELMQAFINGYGYASRSQIQLEFELVQARKHLEQRRAVVNLEVAPERLKQLGLAKASNPGGTEDQRRSVLAQDDVFNSLQDRVAMLEAATEFLKTKSKAFEMSYQAVKKVYDSLSATNAMAVNIPATRAAEHADTFEKTATGYQQTTMTIGKPRY